MLTKIRFFMKGVHFTTDIFFVFIVWVLAEKNLRIENELKEFKDNSYNSYKTSHHPKGKPVPTEKAKHPIGFTAIYSDSEELENSCN